MEENRAVCLRSGRLEKKERECIILHVSVLIQLLKHVVQYMPVPPKSH